MSSQKPVDLVPYQEELDNLLQSLRKSPSQSSWATVETTCQEIANHLRVRNPSVDHHTILGKTDLPQTLTSLLSLALDGVHIPSDEKTSAINEILRVGANFCMDHDDNRAVLLEAQFPQVIVSLLEGYVENIPTPFDEKPIPLSTSHLKVVRTSIGVLLNASLNFSSVKARLNSLECGLTLIKLSCAIFPPTAWNSHQEEPGFVEEWSLRSGISNWIWRTVSTLKDSQDESLHILSSDVLPWITSPLLKFCSPQPPATSPYTESNPDFLDLLIQGDYDFLEESCSLFESLALDLEDFRRELARKTCPAGTDKPILCLEAVLQFIEHGSNPPIWSSPIYDDSERHAKEKGFAMCKAAMIKAVVEVFGEEKNDEVLWIAGDANQPGGPFVETMVRWIQDHVKSATSAKDKSAEARDDMTICASLALGNVARRPEIATTLLSPPYSIAPALASPEFLAPSVDLKLKHGILGLLKHLVQFSKLSPVISKTLAEQNLLPKLAASGVWDERTEAMANIVQLNAIGVAKHLCNGNLEHTFALTLQSDNDTPTGFSQIIALIKRSESVSARSEGSRVVVNVVKSLWQVDREAKEPEQRQKKRDAAVALVLTRECAGILASLISRSNKYPILVNEGIVANTLLSTHKLGAQLVLKALTAPVNGASSTEILQSESSVSSNSASPTLPTPSTVNDGLPVPRHALDMLLYALKNVDNPVNFPLEVRVNVCTFFMQLQKVASPESLVRIKEAILPVAEQVIEESQGVAAEAKLNSASTLLVESFKSS
ncbi:hypothetical protein CPB83DRAFT_784211 [Crepidotus variabilis]|uniref:Uncharacterized protein n=1 Tax=Crepidotus variabilis TaxID=179855 RepID=A0A9P6JTZ4_9AGAR|nr:hypothetical protein CPB83DRAFT_784211 [Crepidotus variabilis]